MAVAAKVAAVALNAYDHLLNTTKEKRISFRKRNLSDQPSLILEKFPFI
jgi:hypothetical protein